jgi:hypothetical protein
LRKSSFAIAYLDIKNYKQKPKYIIVFPKNGVVIHKCELISEIYCGYACGDIKFMCTFVSIKSKTELYCGFNIIKNGAINKTRQANHQ